MLFILSAFELKATEVEKPIPFFNYWVTPSQVDVFVGKWKLVGDESSEINISKNAKEYIVQVSLGGETNQAKGVIMNDKNELSSMEENLTRLTGLKITT